MQCSSGHGKISYLFSCVVCCHVTTLHFHRQSLGTETKTKQNFDSRLILEHRSVDRYTTYLLRKVWIFDSGSIACTTVSSMRGVSGLGLMTTPSSGSSFFAGFLLSNFLQAIVTLHIRTETVLQFLLGAPLQHSLGFRIITHRFLKIRLGEDEELRESLRSNVGCATVASRQRQQTGTRVE